MPKKKEPPQPPFSSYISEFCKLVEAARKDYEWSRNEVSRMDGLTQDYLHMLELDGLNYKERAKVATGITKCRQQRREHKDTVMLLEPLVRFFESDKGKPLFNQLREVLGETRKVEARMANRVYMPRVLGQGTDQYHKEALK